MESKLCTFTNLIHFEGSQQRMHCRGYVHLRPRSHMIFLHGDEPSSRYLLPTAKLLSEHYTALAPDLLGFGKSDKPQRSLTITQHARCLKSWMDVKGIGRVPLVAHSFGCQIALEFAAAFPERVESLLLNSPTMTQTGRFKKSRYRKRLQNMVSEPWSLLFCQAKDYYQWGKPRSKRTLEEARQQGLETTLMNINCPILFVAGSRDLQTHTSWLAYLVTMTNLGRLAVIPGAGHTAVYSHPLEVMRLFEAFRSEYLKQPVQQLCLMHG